MMRKGSFTERYPWWSSMTANVVGVVIGILLTIGADGLHQRIVRKTRTDKMVQLTLRELETNLGKMEDMLTDYQGYGDATYKILLHQDTPAKLTDSLSRAYFDHLVTTSIRIIDHSAEKVFASNLDSWEAAENIETVLLINRLFTLGHAFEERIETINTIRAEHAKQWETEQERPSTPPTAATLQAYVAIPNNRYAMTKTINNLLGAVSLVEYMDYALDSVETMLNLPADELEYLRSFRKPFENKVAYGD